MRRSINVTGAAALLLAATVGALATGNSPELELETIDTVWGHVYAVQLEADAQHATVLSGNLRKSHANGGRRLLGRVRAEIVDEHGDVIATYDDRPQRVSPARHTPRARFAIEIGTLPDQARAIRVVYR